MNSQFVPQIESPLSMRLGYLVEECGEVLAAAGKTLRWGPQSVNPTIPIPDQEPNIDWLRREFADLKHAIALIELGCDAP